MKTRYNFYVTKNDIKNGEPELTRSCPVALAIQRRMQLQDDVWVHSTYAKFGKYRVDLPEQVVDWIYYFDQHNKVHPFRFTLELS